MPISNNKKYPTRKDPITGVQVITMAGFWQMEADNENAGRSAGDLMNEAMDDMDMAMKEEEDKLKDPCFLKSFINEFIDYCNGDPAKGDDIVYDYKIEEVISIGKVQYHFSYSGEKYDISFIAICSDRLRALNYSGYRSHGSFYEPPDEEFNLEEIK